MSKQIILKYYQDAGHGWLAVKSSLLARLGLTTQISCYSYAKGHTVYLEEDRDAGILISALKASGIDYVINPVYHGNASPIRGYASYEGSLDDNEGGLHV